MQLLRATAVGYMVIAALVGSWHIVNTALRLLAKLGL